MAARAKRALANDAAVFNRSVGVDFTDFLHPSYLEAIPQKPVSMRYGELQYSFL